MRVKLLAAVGAVAALGTVAVVAEEPRRMGRANRAAIQAELGLSDEQAAEIRRIHLQERKAAIRRNADLRIARLELEELMSAATVDEAKVAARVKALGELQAAALKDRTESRLAIRRLVTAEQFQKMQQARRGAVRAHRARRGRPPMGAGGGPSGPGGGEQLEEVDPS